MICTIEKSSLVFNALLSAKCIGDIKLVVIDEMHLLQDPSRGYMLEILVSKIKFIERQAENIRSQKPDGKGLKSIRIQLIALSATVGNAPVLAAWMHAKLYRTRFRPVPLTEMIKAGSELLLPDATGLNLVNFTLYFKMYPRLFNCFD